MNTLKLVEIGKLNQDTHGPVGLLPDGAATQQP
jgi:hypothetical protein